MSCLSFQSERLYDFHVLSIQINDTILLPTTCRSKFKTICEIDCSNSALMDEATVKTYRQNVLVRPQFWIFAIAVFVFTISIAVNETAQNTICLDILGIILYIMGAIYYNALFPVQCYTALIVCRE